MPLKQVCSLIGPHLRARQAGTMDQRGKQHDEDLCFYQAPISPLLMGVKQPPNVPRLHRSASQLKLCPIR